MAEQQAVGEAAGVLCDAHRTKPFTAARAQVAAAVVRRDAALLSDYHNGSSLAELQRTYSLGRSSIQKLLRDGAVRRRRKSLTVAERAVLVERYEAGLTIREIASEQDLPKTTVQDALAQRHVQMRSASRRLKRLEC